MDYGLLKTLDKEQIHDGYSVKINVSCSYTVGLSQLAYSEG